MTPLSQHPRIKASRARRAALRMLKTPGHAAPQGFLSSPTTYRLGNGHASLASQAPNAVRDLTARVVKALTSGKAQRKAITDSRAAFHAKLDARPAAIRPSEWTECPECKRIVKVDPRTLADLALHRVPSSTTLVDPRPALRIRRVSVTSCAVRERQLARLLQAGPLPLDVPVTGWQTAHRNPGVDKALRDALALYEKNHRERAGKAAQANAPAPQEVYQGAEQERNAVISARLMDRQAQKRADIAAMKARES